MRIPRNIDPLVDSLQFSGLVCVLDTQCSHADPQEHLILSMFEFSRRCNSHRVTALQIKASVQRRSRGFEARGREVESGNN